MIAAYRIRAASQAFAEARAEAIAVEQSVEMPVAAIHDRFVLDEILGRVLSVREIDDGRYEARIGLATASLAGEAGHLLNMLFGNSSFYEDVSLHDVEFPEGLLTVFAGPSRGIAGLRSELNANSRPLTLSNLKPQGLGPIALAALAGKFATAAVDMIKDDHGHADQDYGPFAERVPRIAEALARASSATGARTLYFPHVTGDLDQLRRRVELARAKGLKGLLIMPPVVGLSNFQTLRRENADMLMIAHPSMAGATRMAPALLLGALFRLFGADALAFPSFGGRFGLPSEECARLAHFAGRNWGDLRPTLPVPAGGMTIELIDELFRFYGPDFGVFLGGSLLATHGDLTAAAARFVESVHGLVEPSGLTTDSIKHEDKGSALGGAPW